jgi:hypothetical protein
VWNFKCVCFNFRLDQILNISVTFKQTEKLKKTVCNSSESFPTETNLCEFLLFQLYLLFLSSISILVFIREYHNVLFTIHWNQMKKLVNKNKVKSVVNSLNPLQKIIIGQNCNEIESYCVNTTILLVYNVHLANNLLNKRRGKIHLKPIKSL